MQDHDQSLSVRVFGLVLLASPFDLVPSRYYYFVCLLRASSGWMSRASPGRCCVSSGGLSTVHYRFACPACVPDCRTGFTRLIVIELRVARARLYVCKIPYRRARLVWRLFSLYAASRASKLILHASQILESLYYMSRTSSGWLSDYCVRVARLIRYLNESIICRAKK